MSYISDERGSLMVIHEAARLTTCREGDLHLALSYLVHISVCGHTVEISLVVFGWAKKWNCQLEEFFVVGLSYIHIFKLKLVIKFES